MMAINDRVIQVKQALIKDVCNTINAHIKIQKTDYLIEGKFPIIDQSFNPIAGYTDVEKAVIDNGEYVIFGDHTRIIKFVDFPFAQGADGIKIIKACSYVQPKFLYYSLCNLDIPNKGYSRHWGLVSNLIINIPSVNVQEEIVKILDSFTNLIDALNEELSLRQKQFEYYREKLLTFDDNIQLKEIGELCSKVDNIKWNNNIELNYIDLSSVPCKDNRIVDCQLVNRDNAPSRARQIIKTNDILFGTTRPTQMRLCVVPKEYNNQICSTGYCVLRINNMNQKYIYYCLSSLRFMDYCDLCQDGGSYPSISDGKVKAYEIPIPSLAIQQSIVEKLDAFESLISSLKEEIALRQKQYEYYREKLLTFD